MNLRHLHVFVTVADCGKMSLAAEKLYMTESTVSQTISKMEKEYGILLFERINKRIYLTYEGKELLNFARRMLSMSDQLEEYIKNLSESNILRIGVSGSASFHIIHQILEQFNEFVPSANITLYHYSNNHIYKLVRSGELDIAMTSINAEPNSDVIAHPITEDKLGIVCGRKHPFWNRSLIELEELQNQPFILRENMSGTRIAFERFLAEHNILVQTCGISNNALYCKYAVQYNPHLTVISEQLCEEEFSNGKLHLIGLDGFELTQNYYLIYHKNKLITPTISAFINVCEQFYKNKHTESDPPEDESHGEKNNQEEKEGKRE